MHLNFESQGIIVVLLNRSLGTLKIVIGLSKRLMILMERRNFMFSEIKDTKKYLY